ncbi:MAG: hypothetical protein ACFFB5_00805 [Promethearchaeota archaeon]
MDEMIILASGHLIISQLASFSMKYSCRQRALSVGEERSEEIRYNALVFMLVIVIPLAILLATILALYVTGSSSFELLFLYPLSMAFLIIVDTEIMIERSLLAADKAIFINMAYTILNSVLVPLFYYINPTLRSILWAWIIGLVVTVLLDIRKPFQILRKKKLNLQTLHYLLRFSFPIYLSQLPRLISSHINKFIMFEFLETGATSIFYWPNRILSIIREMIFIVATGSALLFNKLNIVDKERLRDSFLGLFRTIVLISAVVYFWIYLDAAILIYLLLGEGYIEAVLFFRLLCITWIITSMTTVMINLKDAQGHRRILVKGNLLDFSSKIVLLLILISLGVLGVVLTELFVAILYFVYYLKNTKYLHVNDNFIRLGIFITIVSITAHIGIFIENFDLFVMMILNLIYIGIAIGCFFMIKPLTTRDIRFIDNIIPQKLQWTLTYYHPSKSKFD